jgi:hypothetical protein
MASGSDGPAQLGVQRLDGCIEGSLADLGIGRAIDGPKRLRDVLAILPGGKIHGMADQVNDAGLNDRLRENRIDGFSRLQRPEHHPHVDSRNGQLAEYRRDVAPQTAGPLRAVFGVAPTRFVFLHVFQRAIVEALPAPVIEDIKAAGAKSLGDVARELNAREISAPRGGQWSAAQVRLLLKRVRHQALRQNST